MNDQNVKISGIIHYPADFHALLTEAAKNMRFLAGTSTRPKVADIYFEVFQRAGGMELLKADIALLQEHVAAIKQQPKNTKRPGRPAKAK